jgi:hypothetical protein
MKRHWKINTVHVFSNKSNELSLLIKVIKVRGNFENFALGKKKYTFRWRTIELKLIVI